MAHTLYVLGFAFTPEGQVCLIEKKRPKWQAGRLNGIGGHVENGEAAQNAMQREFYEETSVDIAPEQWKYRGRMHGADWSVFVYTVEHEAVNYACTMTDEEVYLIDTDLLSGMRDRLIENIEALIQLCLLPDAQPTGYAPRFDLDYNWQIN